MLISMDGISILDIFLLAKNLDQCLEISMFVAIKNTVQIDIFQFSNMNYSVCYIP